MNQETLDDMIKTLDQLKKHPEENAQLIQELGEVIDQTKAELEGESVIVVEDTGGFFVGMVDRADEDKASIEDAPKVSLEDLETFFDDPEPVPSNIHEFASLEDLKDTIDEEGEPLKVHLLSLRDIAELAYDLVANYESLMFGKVSDSFGVLSDVEQGDIVARVHDIMQTASNNDDFAIARAQHSQRAMTLLADGWGYGSALNEDHKVTPEVAPWEYLKNEHRMSSMLFRDVARRLVMSVWSGS